MSVVTRTTAKSYFETGDKPTQVQFGDFIDSTMFQEDFSTFGKAFVSASTTASALNLLGANTVGINVIQAQTTASAQTALAGGAVGRAIFEAVTTASATNLLQNASTTANGTRLLDSVKITIEVNGSDPNNDIDFGAHNYQFDDGTGQAVATALTKRLDATWVAGTNQGMLDTGAKANSTTYHLFDICNPTSGISDYLASTSLSSPTMPSGYTKKKWLFSIITDGSGNIRKFLFDDLGGGMAQCTWDTPINDVTLSALSTSATLRTLTTPAGIKATAITNISWTGDNDGTGIRYGLITSPDQTDTAPSATIFNITSYFGASEDPSAITRFETRTNTSSQIRDRFDTTGGTMVANGYKISTIGWRYKA